jgi:hypothetical protein
MKEGVELLNTIQDVYLRQKHHIGLIKNYLIKKSVRLLGAFFYILFENDFIKFGAHHFSFIARALLLSACARQLAAIRAKNIRTLSQQPGRNSNAHQWIFVITNHKCPRLLALLILVFNNHKGCH